MAIQVFNDGACIRIEDGGKTLLITKEQVKTIDTVQGNIVRLDIGEGPLKNIFIRHGDVSNPVTDNADELRDRIKAMLLISYNAGGATEQSQNNIIQELINLRGTTNDILTQLNKFDFLKVEPQFIDESDLNTIYKGWTIDDPSPEGAKWAIQRIRRQDEIVIYEWAEGARNFEHVWASRLTLNYGPYLSELRP